MSDIARTRIAALIIVLVGVLLAISGPLNLVLEGPFIWAIQQPGAWQGGIELGVLATLIGGAVYYLRGWQRGLLLGMLGLLYARRHGVDLALVGSLAYFEGIASVGLVAYRRISGVKDCGIDDYLIAISMGLLTWSCIEWVISAIGLGSLRDLEIASILVLGGALCLERRPPIVSFLYTRIGHRNISAALMCAFACTVVLMLFAKSAVSIDFDSLWYGMRGDRVLVSGGSVFRSLGLVASVHYAPQAYELILVPLSGLHSITATFGFTIWCVLALGICLYAIGNRLGWKPALTLMMVAVALATPAVLNIAITAKGDILAAYWIFFGLYGFIRYRQSKDWRWLLLMLSGAPAAISFRMSVFVYAGVLALIALIYLTRELLVRSKDSAPGPLRACIWLWIVVGSVGLFALVTVRTYLLAGVPFIEPGILVHLTEMLGFARKFPASNAPPQDIGWNHEILPLLFDFVFRPTKLPHILIAWTGGAFVFFSVVGLALNRFTVRAFSGLYIFWIFAGTFIVLLQLVQFPDRGGDGNYYIVPVLCSLIAALGLVGNNLLQKNLLGRSLRAVLSLFVTCSVLVALVTGSWGPGTRGFDLDFRRSGEDYNVRAKAALTYSGMMPIYEFLHKLPRDTRVLGLVPDSMLGNLPDSWLPVREESLNAIAMYMPAYANSSKSIEDFIGKDQIEYMMLPTDGSPYVSSQLIVWARSALDELEVKHQAIPVVVGDRFTLWKIALVGELDPISAN